MQVSSANDNFLYVIRFFYYHFFLRLLPLKKKKKKKTQAKKKKKKKGECNIAQSMASLASWQYPLYNNYYNNNINVIYKNLTSSTSTPSPKILKNLSYIHGNMACNV